MSSISKSLSVLLACGALAVSTPVRGADAWPSFRGADGTGRTESELPLGETPLSLALAWQRPLGGGYSGLSVADDRLVTAAAIDGRDVVLALDAATGAELWRYDLAPSYAGHDGSHDGPMSTPAIADGRVFVLGPRGHLVALDFETGRALWITDLVADHGCAAPFYGFATSPLVVDDLLLVQVGGSEGAVAAFDVASGALRWRGFGDQGEPGGQSPIAAEIAGRRQVLVLGAAKVGGLAPEDGSLLWELELEGRPGAMGAMTQSPLPIDDRRLLVKHQDGEAVVVEVTATESGLAAAIVASGSGLARSYSPPTLAGSALYGYSARFLSAVDPDGAELLWRSRAPGDGFLVSVGDHLAVITKTGSLHLGAASRDGWQETASLDLFTDLAWTPPSYADGSIFVRSLGEIARVDVRRSAGARAASEESHGDALPAALRSLADRLVTAERPAEAVDAFLAGRELPLVDGEEVVFLWRGAAEDVAIGGDMIGMRREEPMRRLAGTDLWWWRATLDRRARIDYLFFVDDRPATDPTHPRRTSSRVLGPDMNWFRGESVEMSWFAMPEWPGLGRDLEASGAPPRGRLESFEITLQPPSPEGGEPPEAVSVPVRVWLPPGYDAGDARYPVVYLHHPAAFEQGGWPGTLDRVVGRTVQPLIAVSPEPPRLRGYEDLFVGQLVPRIDARYRTRAERDARAIVGMGWPGFGASMVTFSHPETFGRLGLQSLFLLEEHLGYLREAIGDADASTLPMAIYLEWGRWDLVSPHEEMDMRRSSRWAWDLFRDKGWEPLGGEVWDSTDFASWRNRTDVLLESLFPLTGSSSTLASWRTGR